MKLTLFRAIGPMVVIERTGTIRRSNRRPRHRPTAPGLGFALTISAMLLTGCAAGGAESVSAEEPSGESSALPPGVLPPNDPPQPGDARLRPDGHYDYSAPDFVLKNPCDTVYFQRAMELGWQVPPIGTKRRDEPGSGTCSMINDSTGLPLVSFGKTAANVEAEGHSVDLHPTESRTLYVIKGEAIFGESCFAGMETESGLIGAMSGTGGFSQFSHLSDACTEAIETINPILGGS